MVDAVVSVRTPDDFSLVRSQRLVCLGALDPCMRVDDDVVWRATRTPEGPATYKAIQRDATVEVEVWGEGTRWIVHNVAELLGVVDRPHDFSPEHPRLRAMHARLPIYLPRSLALFERLAPTILHQLVTWKEAMLAYRGIVRDLGEPAPGPGSLWIPPSAKILARAPSHLLGAHGVLLRHADTIRRAAKTVARLEPGAFAPQELSRHLEAVPGIGPWTAQSVLACVVGHADAVPTGDVHLPNLVAWALAGEPRGDDARMLQLLEPFAGHRWRVITLLRASNIAAPRRGPRRGMQTRRRIRDDGRG